jgi:hypothetical protein
MNPSAPRVMFFYDGFILYHSLERARLAAPTEPVKWLDLAALAQAHVYILGPTETVAGVRYFTAYAEHLALTKPDRLSRDRAYVRALTATGVQVYLGHFKPKQVWTASLARFERIWQDKATDVNIVAQVFAHAARDAFDGAVIVWGDADYAPAVPVFREMFPQKRLIFGFPFDRKNRELERVALPRLCSRAKATPNTNSRKQCACRAVNSLSAPMLGDPRRHRSRRRNFWLGISAD